MQRYLIIGASGTVGSLVAAELVSQKQDVFGLTSQMQRVGESQDGMQWLHGDLASGEGIEQAFSQADRAFIFCPPGYVPQNDILNPLIDAAKANQLKKVVLLTALGADADPASPLRQAEMRLEQSGVAYNIVRPNWFMQNFNTFWLAGINQQNKILLPTGTAKGSFIDIRDIAAVVVRLLTADDVNNQAFDLTGAESLDHDEVARILSEKAGRLITYEQITDEQMLQGLVQAGVPVNYAQFLVLILGFFAQGYSAHTTDAVERLLGRQPISFKHYAEEMKAIWQLP